MVENHNKYNILHYGSNKCQRIEISVMDTEVQERILGFYLFVLIKTTVEKILGRKMKIEAMTDS